MWHRRIWLSSIASPGSPAVATCGRFSKFTNKTSDKVGRRSILNANDVSLVELASQHVDTTHCRNQADLARSLKPYIRTPQVFQAVEAVDRALFLPSVLGYQEPYANRPQRLHESGASMSTPFHHVSILNILEEHGLSQSTKVLDIGCGTGWLTAAMYTIMTKGGGGNNKSPKLALGLDRISDLIKEGRIALGKCPVTKDAFQAGQIILEDAYDDVNKSELRFSLLDKYGPFDFIHAGFTFDSTKDKPFIDRLCSYLRPTSTNVGGILLAGFGRDLCVFNSQGMRKELAHIPGMSPIQYGKYEKPLTRMERMDLAKQKLDEWKINFEKTQKRKPNKDDLFNDPIASQLFKEFSNATKLS